VVESEKKKKKKRSVVVALDASESLNEFGALRLSRAVGRL
jgi:hypothetical protein